MRSMIIGIIVGVLLIAVMIVGIANLDFLGEGFSHLKIFQITIKI